MQPKRLEVWSDTFKEGEWFLETLSVRFGPGNSRCTYRHGFQPVYTFLSSGGPELEVVVYGDYDAWDPLPEPVRTLISHARPDIVLYDHATGQIILAVEETAAVPTGNQSLQRLERVWFAARQRVPFAYLVSEYGMHVDGGARRTSIWPAYLALKLSSQYRVPSLALLYGDAEHPEDYAVGAGVADLSRMAYVLVREWLGDDVAVEKRELFVRVFREMGEFIVEQAGEISPYLPGLDLLASPDFVDFIAGRVASDGRG